MKNTLNRRDSIKQENDCMNVRFFRQGGRKASFHCVEIAIAVPSNCQSSVNTLRQKSGSFGFFTHWLVWGTDYFD